MRLWIAERSLASLSRLPVDAPPAGPDRSVHVPAMAAYVRSSGSQIALPRLRRSEAGERIADGERLLQALAAAGWEAPVACIVDAADPERPAAPFSAEAAGRYGTDAVLVTLARAPSEPELQRIALGRPAPPRLFERVHLAWPSPDEAHADGWAGLIGSFAELPVPVAAINGRLPPSGA